MPDLQYVHIDGHKLAAFAYNVDIQSVPIVFIHGFSTNITYWAQSQIPVINERFRWFSLSLPGHYPAMFPDDFTSADLTPTLLARLLITAIKELVGTQPVILVGHSTGGFASLLIAETAPDMVKGIICVAGFADGNWDGALGRMQKQVRWGPLGRFMVKTQLRVLGLHPRVLKDSLKYFAADLDAVYARPDIDAAIAEIFEYRKHLDADAMNSYLIQMPSIDISDCLPRIACPTLVLTGDCDPICARDQSVYIHERLANSQLIKLEGAGHLPMLERAQEYQEAITSWLAAAVG